MNGPQAHFDAANRALQQGNPRRTLEIVERLLKKAPRQPEFLVLAARAELALASAPAAIKRLEKAVKAAPNSAPIRVQLARALREDSRLDAAAKQAAEARRLDPGFQPAAVFDAGLRRLHGRNDEAIEILRPIVEAGKADPGTRVLFAQVIAAVEGPEAGLAMLEDVIADPVTVPAQRTKARFRLAGLLDRAGRHDEAFQAADRANTESERHFDADSHDAQIDAIIAGWSSDLFEIAPSSGEMSELPVLIVGMMRSGTSLAEQILASHPEVAGAGERMGISKEASALFATGGGNVRQTLESGALTQGALQRSARRYLKSLRTVDRHASRVTDKMPANYLFLGPVQLMLPKARIIHCVRSPMDTCFSCWMLSFAGGSHDYAYDQVAIARYYRAYRRLMAHWTAVLDVPILELRYEDLVGDPEPQIRRLIDFVGLDWDDRCLAFHETERATLTLSTEQVRRPLYAGSIGRWKRVADRLEPMRTTLGDLAEESGP